MRFQRLDRYRAPYSGNKTLRNRVRGSLVGLLTGVMVWCATTVSAQVTYTVFPANPGSPAAVLPQPTEPGGRAHVTLVLRDSTIDYIVRTLAHQANLRPAYRTSDPAYNKRIDIHLDNVDVMTAFATVLKGTGLVATLAADGKMVVIRPQSGSADRRDHGLTGVIVGRVIDSASGAGLGGAAVRIAGSQLSAVTSDSGNFTFKTVPAGDQVLTVKLFGYKPVERTVTVVDSQRTIVRIGLVAIPTVLSGVVTTATGVEDKVKVGNDITTINADSVMRIAPVTSVTDLLETRVPGLTILHSSGAPGDPARIRLRGASSIYGNNDPVIIVDGIRVYGSQSDPRNRNLGVIAAAGSQITNGNTSLDNKPSPLDQIDPASIETIEVLKGPSASALYGSDAASGVIVITTKHGRAGPTHWHLELGEGVNWFPGNWPVNYYRFGYDSTGVSRLIGLHGQCPWTDALCATDSLITFQALTQPQFTVFAHGSDQTANLTISGGVPAVQYTLTGSTAGDIGNLKLPMITRQLYETSYGSIPTWMLRPLNYQTWGTTATLAVQPAPTTHITISSSLFTSTQQQSSLLGALAQVNGEYVDSALLAAGQPYIQSYVQRATSNQVTSTNALSLNWQPRPWFPLTAAAGFNTVQGTDETYIPFGVNYYGVRTCNGFCDQSSNDTTGWYGVGHATSHNETFTVGTAIPLFHNLLMLAVGGNVNSQSTNDITNATNQLGPGVTIPSQFVCTISGGTIPCPSTLSTTQLSTYGWYVEPRLNFASKFFVAPGFRLDGGSGGSHVSYGGGGLSQGIGGLSAFPKIDLSYVAVDRQNQRPLWGMLTLLRPRLAFGYAGTQPAPADKLRLLSGGNDSYLLTVPGVSGSINTLCGDGAIALNGVNSGPVQEVCLTSLGNTQLRPERTSELEGGADATLWQGKITLTYTKYDKTRHDAVIPLQVAQSVSGDGSGGNTILKNIGVIRNTGTELTVNTFLIQNRAVSWNIGANLSNNNSLVVSLNPGQPPLCFSSGSPCQGTRIVTGYPVFGVWARPIVSFADFNHDGIIEPNEVRLGDSSVYVGQPDPKYQFNFNSDLTLLNGRLHVHATLAYQNGLLQNNLGALTSGAFLAIPNRPGTSLATQAAIVEALCSLPVGAQGTPYITGLGTTATCDQNNSTAIGLMQVVNSFRFQDLSINYELPHTIASWFRVPRMTVALQGNNLGLHSNYRGFDPNVNAFSTVGAGDETADTGQLPEPRTWWLKVTFDH